MAGTRALITEEPNNEVKFLIGKEFFGDGFSHTDGFARFASYFEFHAKEVRELQFSRFQGANQTAELAIKTYQDLADVIHVLRENPAYTRPDIRAELQKKLSHNGDVAINRAIDICLRWWLMLNLREDMFKGLGSGRPSFQWDDSTQLRNYVGELFPRSKWQLGRKESRLAPEFTVAYMHNVCKLRIRWTSSLEDHLRLQIRDEKTLWIFPYKACLVAWLHGRNSNKDACASLLSRELLRETIRSLNLLFPVGTKADDTEKFLHEEAQTFQSIGPFESSNSLMDFDHWRDRLLDLHEMVFLNQPFTIKRFWQGLQDPEKFMNFWVVLVLISGLTLVSTIASIIQAVKAFQA
ncbi:uncharacterized protein PV07_12026 [Cladophialophora immunda]|uniref:Uncharacterized protein n=1 Tax=Cladophialophora immunda TaxID=569365 RepID=A0A0D2BXL0_9EURO|nr:uncharacterized protein PV07_12026 [Cladophialophora immunda]KIW23858.1 hypothetical protein PV07_12026 [Cladophialophora immunda]OQU95556.1 hypothetical protein CLAIMM_01741 [Cladophialophora immunda]